MLFGAVYGYQRAGDKRRNSQDQASGSGNVTRQKKGGKGNVDKEFWERIFKLVRYVVPNWKCREVKYIVTLAVLLVIRTLMSIWLADVNGRVVKAIVDKDLKQFIKRVSTPTYVIAF